MGQISLRSYVLFFKSKMNDGPQRFHLLQGAEANDHQPIVSFKYLKWAGDYQPRSSRLRLKQPTPIMGPTELCNWAERKDSSRAGFLWESALGSTCLSNTPGGPWTGRAARRGRASKKPKIKKQPGQTTRDQVASKPIQNITPLETPLRV